MPEEDLPEVATLEQQIGAALFHDLIMKEHSIESLVAIIGHMGELVLSYAQMQAAVTKAVENQQNTRPN
jgi:hypothetical protein|tara:strand:- start:21908 stop:22114 length:207 start_codon:yes stop_codon:yes gene_type:complete